MSTAEIKALARMIDRIDYYRLLKVEPAAHLGLIRPAYRDARRRFHPDNFLNDEEELRSAADLISRRITEAYMVLRDQGRRAAYDKTLSRGVTRFDSTSQEEARNQANVQRGLTANGRRFCALADEDERRGNLAKAVSNLKMALTFEPSNAAFKSRIQQIQDRLKA